MRYKEKYIKNYIIDLSNCVLIGCVVFAFFAQRNFRKICKIRNFCTLSLCGNAETADIESCSKILYLIVVEYVMKPIPILQTLDCLSVHR